MSISLLLEMAVSADPDRAAISWDGKELTAGGLSDLADGGAGVITKLGAQHVAYVGAGAAMLPVLMFSAARAGVPVTPLNYRLSAAGLRELIDRLPRPLVVADAPYLDAVGRAGLGVVSSQVFLRDALTVDPVRTVADPDQVAVVLFTSGTTSRPKAVELTHANLTGYITQTVEFASSAADDAALICVPPYHIAGVSAVLSNLYAGRRMVYLPRFDADDWIRLVHDQNITNATVVPTMLDRIIEALEARPELLPSLRTLAYGGSRVPLPLVRRALKLLPDTGFVNAYGLTETSSTVAVLTPEDHRDADVASDAAVARRLGSVGRAVSGIELQIRDEHGAVLPPDHTGELWVRGPQVSGRYGEIGSVLDADGWFATRDVASLDADGYLFIGGRADDTIIRGGENIAPAEIEDVLVEHPDVRRCAVIGIENPSWGQIIVAAVVPDGEASPDPESLRDFVRVQLRGSRTPDRVVFLDELPANASGKVVRGELEGIVLTALGQPSH
ncbi:MAG: fatty acid--CoA ligase family protein [Mycobacterium sp.]|uniref:class I adenylate-forming enzyme family protein n=1 Tax=Mycobacterium sp. TaxID=1785 RepID=UPI003BAF48E8